MINNLTKTPYFPMAMLDLQVSSCTFYHFVFFPDERIDLMNLTVYFVLPHEQPVIMIKLTMTICVTIDDVYVNIYI